MTRNDAPDATDAQHATVDDRYASLSMADGTVVVYDSENPEAWIQSGTTVAIEEVR